MIRSRFDKNNWTGGLNLMLAGDGPVSVDLGYRAEVGKSVTSHDARFTLRARF